jgi:maltose O-acetyltransferase
MSSDTRTEKEKMLACELYNAMTSPLIDERLACRKLVYEFNLSRPEDSKQRVEILRKMFGSLGTNSFIEPPMQCDYGYNIHWGNNSAANYNLVILDVCPVHVGNDVLMGPDVKLYGGTHPTDPQQRLTGLEYGKPIRIGNNVWIGGNVSIIAGVTIGDNSVIGAGSVVVRDIPDNVVAVGNPCKVVKQLQAPTRDPNQFQQTTGVECGEKKDI